MKRSGLRLAFCALLALALVATVQADSIWQRAHGGSSGTGRSLFSDPRATGVGDIVYVLVSEVTTATSTATTTTDRESESSNASGTGLLSFLPFFSWNNDESYRGEGASSRQGALTGRLTARLMEEIAPGVYRIEGAREVAVNEDKQTMHLSGTIRAIDISPTNTIQSDQIADAVISYSGVGPIARKQKPGILTRLVDWLF